MNKNKLKCVLPENVITRVTSWGNRQAARIYEGNR